MQQQLNFLTCLTILVQITDQKATIDGKKFTQKIFLAWVRFKLLGKQVFIRVVQGLAPARASEQNLVRLGQVVRSI
jgi:hypothetical protein